MSISTAKDQKLDNLVDSALDFLKKIGEGKKAAGVLLIGEDDRHGVAQAFERNPEFMSKGYAVKVVQDGDRSRYDQGNAWYSVDLGWVGECLTSNGVIERQVEMSYD